MRLSRDIIIETLEQLQKGELSEADFYEQQAIAHLDEQDFTLPSVGAIGATFLGFALLGPLGAIGVGVAAGSALIGRFRTIEEQRAQVEQGNPEAIYNALPKDFKPVYPHQPKPKEKEGKAEVTPIKAGEPKPPRMNATLVEMATRAQSQPQPISPVDMPPKLDSQERVTSLAVAAIGDTTPSASRDSDMTPACHPDVTFPQVAESFEGSTDTAQLIADRGLRCHLFVGGSGTGKSLLASTALRKLQQQNPEAKIWVVSAKCDRAESGYWSGFDRYSFWDFVGGGFGLKSAAFEDWLNIIVEFKRLEIPGLLLFDELSLILGEAETMAKNYQSAAFFKEQFCSLLNVFSSAGRSTQKAVWGISPTGAMNGLGGIKRSTIGPFLSVFNAQLGEGFHHSVWRDASTNGLAPAATPTYDDQLKARQLGCTLLTGIGDRWHPTQRYEVPPIDTSIVNRFRRERTDMTMPPIPPIAVSPPKPIAATPPARPTPVVVLPAISDSDIEGSVRAAIARGKGKTETLKSLGLRPGANQAWQNASELFDRIKENR